MYIEHTANPAWPSTKLGKNVFAKNTLCLVNWISYTTAIVQGAKHYFTLLDSTPTPVTLSSSCYCISCWKLVKANRTKTASSSDALSLLKLWMRADLH